MIATVAPHNEQPSPLEIERECRQIRSRWSKAMRRQRRAHQQPPWRPPYVHVDTSLIDEDHFVDLHRSVN